MNDDDDSNPSDHDTSTEAASTTEKIISNGLVKADYMLFVARALNQGDPDNFVDAMLERFGTPVTPYYDALDVLARDYEAAGLKFDRPEYEKFKKQKRLRKSAVRMLSSYLELSTPGKDGAFYYIPPMKDAVRLFTSPLPMIKTERLNKDLCKAQEIVDNTLATIAKIAVDVKRVAINSINPIPIPHSLEVPVAREQSSFMQETRSGTFRRVLTRKEKRKQPEARGENLDGTKKTWAQHIGKTGPMLQKPKPKATFGTGGKINGASAAPPRTVAAKIKFVKTITIEQIQNWCKQTDELKDKSLKFEKLGENRDSLFYRVVSETWTSKAKITDSKLWPDGLEVTSWSQQVRPIKPRARVTKFVGNLHPDTTVQGMKSLINQHYAPIAKDIDIIVEKFIGQKKRDDISNFIVRVSTENPPVTGLEDIFETIFPRNADRRINRTLRVWTGPLESEFESNASKARKTEGSRRLIN